MNGSVSTWQILVGNLKYQLDLTMNRIFTRRAAAGQQGEAPDGDPIPESRIAEDYVKGEVLGEGAFGVVYKAKHKRSGVDVAIKKQILMPNKASELRMVRTELSCMKRLQKHPHIVKLHEYHIDDEKLILVMDYAKHDLFEAVIRRAESGGFTEDDVGQIIYRLLSALLFIRDKNIVHRDIKPENILVRDVDNIYSVQLADFGLAAEAERRMDPELAVFEGVVGSMVYQAPEVAKGGLAHNYKCDIWSLGVVAYTILCNYTPVGIFLPHLNSKHKVLQDVGDFGAVDVFVTTRKVAVKELEKLHEGELQFRPDRIWAERSDEVKDFIQQMLNPDFEERPNQESLMRHEWLKLIHEEFVEADAAKQAEMMDPSYDFLKRFANTIDVEPIKMMKSQRKMLRTVLIQQSSSALRDQMMTDRERAEQEEKLQKYTNDMNLNLGLTLLNESLTEFMVGDDE